MTPDTPDYGPDRQAEVYLNGMLEDERPEFPVSYEDLEKRAREELSEEAFAYVAGGAGSESTVAANDRAFDAWQIVPESCGISPSATCRLTSSAASTPRPSCSRPSASVDPPRGGRTGRRPRGQRVQCR